MEITWIGSSIFKRRRSVALASAYHRIQLHNFAGLFSFIAHFRDLNVSYLTSRIYASYLIVCYLIFIKSFLIFYYLLFKISLLL